MPRRIHVLQLIKNFAIESGGGGIERFGIALAQALDPLRFQVTVCGLWSSGTSFEQDRMRDITTHGINAFTAAKWNEKHPYLAFWNAYRGLRTWLSHNPVDLLNCHSEFADMAVISLGFKRKSGILRTIHNREWSKRPLRRIFLTNFLYPILFHKEIGVSMGIVEALNHRPVARLLHKQALCIHNAVDLDRFSSIHLHQSAKKAELGLPLDAPIIGTVGRLTRQKGYPFLLDAAARVLDEMPQARFMVIGDGEGALTLRDQASRLGIIDKVLFTGPRSDVDELLPIFDLFVSSSLWEGLPTVILESMAAGVPVVATDIPGTRELAVNQAIGWLVEAGNEQALAKAILAALRDPSQRKTCTANARQVVRSFSISAIAQEYETLYAEIVNLK